MRERTLTALLLACLVAAALSAQVSDETVFMEARILCPVLLRVPPEVSGSAPPLLIGLHGKGAAAAGFLPVWEAFRRPRPLLAVPEAPYPLLLDGGRLGWSWDFPSTDRRLWERADPEVARYILEVAREVSTKHRVGGVYLLAHSQGVSYAYMAMVEDPALVRGVIAFAGILPEELMPDERLAPAAGKTRIFIAHGRQDQAINIKSSRDAKDRLERLGFAVTFREFEGGHTLPAEVLREAQEWVAAIENGAPKVGIKQ
jgi:phospholipase/carboxylesterase